MIATSDRSVDQLFKTVVDGGYCIGCGACAAVNASPIQMKLDEYGQLKAMVEPSTDQSQLNSSVQTVCPFSSESLNEDQIGQELFAKNCQYHDKIGYHLSTYAGFVCEGGFREHGSSGGMGTWIVYRLLEEGLVDGVIHVHQRKPSGNDPRLFQYQIATTAEQVQQGAKSRYYPIEMSEIMQLVRERPGRYAIVGIPCFLKAVRLLMKEDSIIAERIQFCIGLVCGHLKSMRFAQMFAWQCGIEPDQLLSINFRKKLPDADANRYGVEVVGMHDDQVITRVSPVFDLYGTDWGLGYFKYKACDYCDDVVAETADVTVGDAWLPQYVKDSQGTNVIVVRHPVIHDLIERAIASGSLNLDRIDADDVARSQASGFTHRRDGLAYRLHLTDRQGKWRPEKRVQPSAKHLDRNLKTRYETRMMLAEESHLAFKSALEADQFSLFVQKMEPIVRRYRATYQQHTLWRRTVWRLKGLMKRLLKA